MCDNPRSKGQQQTKGLFKLSLANQCVLLGLLTGIWATHGQLHNGRKFFSLHPRLFLAKGVGGFMSFSP